jgi:hypothetical protein
VSWVRAHSLPLALGALAAMFFAMNVAGSWKKHAEEQASHRGGAEFWGWDFWSVIVQNVGQEGFGNTFGVLILAVLFAAGAMEKKAKDKQDRGEAGGAS